MNSTESNRGRGRVIGIGVAIVAVAALAAYLLWPRGFDYVMVVGDSVTFLSGSQIEDEMGSDVSVEQIAVPGYTSSDLVDPVTLTIEARARSGQQLERGVFLVGYNDVIRGDVETADLDRLMQQSARFDCAIWLTLPAEPSGAPAGSADFDPEAARRWNEGLVELVGHYDGLHLVRTWEERVNGSDPGELLQADGVHPNDAGRAALAQVMHEGLRDQCRPING